MSKTNFPQNSSEICAKCGAFCCKYNLRKISDYEAKHNEYEFDYYKTRAAKHHHINGIHYCVMHQPCHHLRDNNQCGIYSVRPGHCADFPQRWDEDWALFCPLMNEMYKGEN